MRLHKKLAVLMLMGAGDFAAAGPIAFRQPAALPFSFVPVRAIADVNADGLDDLLLFDAESENLELWLNGDSGFTGTVLNGSGWLQPELVDIGRDGDLDIIDVTSAAGGVIRVYRNDGATFSQSLFLVEDADDALVERMSTLSFSLKTVAYGAGEGEFAVASNGVLAVLDGSTNEASLSLLFGDTASGETFAAGDVNGDGMIDQVGFVSTGALAIRYGVADSLPLEFSDAQLLGPIINTPYGPATGVAIEDVDGDGDNDLVVKYAGPSGLNLTGVWENRDGQFQAVANDPNGSIGGSRFVDGRFTSEDTQTAFDAYAFGRFSVRQQSARDGETMRLIADAGWVGVLDVDHDGDSDLVFRDFVLDSTVVNTSPFAYDFRQVAGYNPYPTKHAWDFSQSDVDAERGVKFSKLSSYSIGYQNAQAGKTPLLASRFTLSADADGAKPPVRVFDAADSFAYSHGLVITDTWNGSFARMAQPANYWNFFSPVDADYFRMNVDRVDAYETLGAENIYLSRTDLVMLYQEDLTDVRRESSLDLSQSETAAAWQSGVGIGAAGDANFARTPQGLAISGARGDSPFFGYWGSPELLTLETGRLYRMRFMVSSTAPTRDANPTFRCRMNDTTFQASAYLNIESLGFNNIAPMAGEVLPYDVWFECPPELDGNGIVLAFDDLCFTEDDDWSTVLTLHSVIVDSFAAP